MRTGKDEEWIQHFYVLPEHEGRGLSCAVLRDLLDRRDDPRPVRLPAVLGSAAPGLYARHGFIRERDHENGIDVVLARPLDSSPTEVVARSPPRASSVNGDEGC